MNGRVFLAVIGILGIGVLAGYFVTTFLDEERHQEEGATSKQVRQMGSYLYTNPLLECEVADGSIDAEKQNFRRDLEKFIETLKERHELAEAAVYYRDLNNGPSFGVNMDGQFFPASLLKVPVMMLYYRWSEQDPGLMGRVIPYEKPKDFGVTPTIIPEQALVPGHTYTVEELVQRMITYSDNQALGLLTERLPIEKTLALFQMLDVPEEVVTSSEGKLRVSEYASFFRILFNSSYLSRENSEKALGLLAHTEFDMGLVAGVAEGVVVSHKFGEAGTGDVERQLHDCGIVYFPGHPYLACIMTRGQDTKRLEQALQETSRFIYERIDAQY